MTIPDASNQYRTSAYDAAIGRAQALLDPIGSGVFSASRLLPYVHIAHEDMKRDAASEGEIMALSALDVAGLSLILGYWAAGLVAVAGNERTLGVQYIAEARHLFFRHVQRRRMAAVHRRHRGRCGGGAEEQMTEPIPPAETRLRVLLPLVRRIVRLELEACGGSHRAAGGRLYGCDAVCRLARRIRALLGEEGQKP